jgi:hypothetical protein
MSLKTSPHGDTHDEMVQAIGRLLQQVIAAGFELPIYVGAVSRNGCTMWACCSSDDFGGVKPTMISENTPHPTMTLPINIFMVDSRGVAARLVLEQDKAASERLLC